MRLAVMMPVGPGEADRHLERCIRHAHSWADTLIVYGDAPDPATIRLIEQHATHWKIGAPGLYEQAEHLMRNQLYEMADEILADGDLIASLDADEEIHATPERTRKTLLALKHDPRESYNIHFLHLWNEAGTLHRVDGAWQPSIGPRIFKHRKGYRLQPLYESAWVCPGLPPHLLGERSASLFDVLHWSYAREHDRRPKYDRYKRLPGHSGAHIESIIAEPAMEAIPCRFS